MEDCELLSKEQKLDIFSSISFQEIFSLAGSLRKLNRHPGSSNLEDVCELIAVHLKEIGDAQIDLASFPYGPEHRYFFWSRERMPIVEEAELWLLHPDETESLLCQSSIDPGCIIGSYKSTPIDGEVFKVVNIGAGTLASDYSKRQFENCVILTSGHHFEAAMFEALGQRKAAGILVGPGDGVEDFHRRTLSERSLLNRRRPFGFNLSAKGYHRLMNRCASGQEVRVRAKIRVAMDSGTFPFLSVTLPGCGEEEGRVLVLAEMCEPASPVSAACMAELVRAVRMSIVQGKVPPLKRTLQFLFVAGAHGLVPWLFEHQHELDTFKASLLLSVDRASESVRSGLKITSVGSPSFLRDLVEYHSKFLGGIQNEIPVETQALISGLPVHFELTPGLPARPSLLDPLMDLDFNLCGVELQLSGWVEALQLVAPVNRIALQHFMGTAISSVFELCHLAEEDLPFWIGQSHLKAYERLAHLAQWWQGNMSNTADKSHQGRSLARHLLWLFERSLGIQLEEEKNKVQNLRDFFNGPGQHALLLADTVRSLEKNEESLLSILSSSLTGAFEPERGMVAQRRALTPLERRAGCIIVKRQVEGPFPTPLIFIEAKEADRLWLIQNGAALARVPSPAVWLRFIDGKRTILDIFECVSPKYPAADLNVFWRYLDILQGAGMIELVEISDDSRPLLRKNS